MDKVINLQDKHIEKVEAKAKEIYKAIKLEEDSYLIPANIVNSKEIDESFLKSDLYKDKKLRSDIEKLKFVDKQYVSISCKKILNNNVKILEVIRVGSDVETDGDLVEELEVESDLSHDDREYLLNMIAYANRDKEIFITFYIHYNFNLLEGLVSEE